MKDARFEPQPQVDPELQRRRNEWNAKQPTLSYGEYLATFNELEYQHAELVYNNRQLDSNQFGKERYCSALVPSQRVTVHEAQRGRPHFDEQGNEQGIVRPGDYAHVAIHCGQCGESTDAVGRTSDLFGLEKPVLYGMVRLYPWKEFDSSGVLREDLGWFGRSSTSDYLVLLDEPTTPKFVPMWCEFGHGTFKLETSVVLNLHKKHWANPGNKPNPFARGGRIETHAPAEYFLKERFD